MSVIVYVIGTFDLFHVTCKQHQNTMLNPFLDGIKTVTLMVRVNEALDLLIRISHNTVIVVVDIVVPSPQVNMLLSVFVGNWCRHLMSLKPVWPKFWEFSSHEVK